ncbi:MAG: dihydrolipoamide acetyltransferase family protein [Hyphomicrobiaceae bacterium]
MKVFRLPDIGEGLQEAEIVSWHVSPGDHVVSDQPLLAIESDKAVVEIPSPYSGTIVTLHGAVGDIVRVGAPLVGFSDEAGADVGAIVGELGTDKAAAAVEKSVTSPTRTETISRIAAAPAVRALAVARGLDLADVRGTGPGGTILRSDVDAAVSGPETMTGFERLRGARRVMASNMERAGSTIVPATVTDLVDVTNWWRKGADITCRVLSGVATAAQHEPSLNAWYHAATLSRKLHPCVDIGLAVDAPEGLYVPVIRDVATLRESEIQQRVSEVVDLVRMRALTPEQVRNPTITVSNFGSIGGRHAHLVLLPPQVAIIGIGRAETSLQLIDERVTERTMLPVSLTFDHRAVTGGEAARFLAVMRDHLQTKKNEPRTA